MSYMPTTGPAPVSCQFDTIDRRRCQSRSKLLSGTFACEWGVQTKNDGRSGDQCSRTSGICHRDFHPRASFWAFAICVGVITLSSLVLPIDANITMGPARMYPWRKMRRSRAPSIATGALFVAQSEADCMTNMAGFNARQPQATSNSRIKASLRRRFGITLEPRTTPG